jgi:hypothetical protein
MQVVTTCSQVVQYRVVIPSIWRPFGERTGQAALSIMPYMNRAGGTVDREITVPNLLYCQHGHVEDGSLRWLPMVVRRHLFDPSNLPWAVSQCPFDPYRAGAKVYRAGGQPAP